MTTIEPREAFVDTFRRASAETADMRLVADQFLAEGWRPPLPADETERVEFRATSIEADPERAVWYVTVFDEPVHHTTEGVPVNVDWTRDGTLIGVQLLGSGNLKPAPQVFFPGDTVPGDVCVVDEAGTFYSDDRAWEVSVVAPVVALVSPSPEEWQAVVDRARADRKAHRDV